MANSLKVKFRAIGFRKLTLPFSKNGAQKCREDETFEDGISFCHRCAVQFCE